jgi:hypothetical protein
MGLTGNLKTMALAEVLQWLSQGQKTGTLVVHGRPVEKRVFFRDGRIISTSSTDPKEYLGHFLVSHGYIDEETLSRAVKMQEQQKTLLGKILTDLGAISEEDLGRFLVMKAEESIYDMFAWPEGEFRFLDDELPQMTMIPLWLDVTGLILEGMQRVDEWKRIREKIPSMQCIPVAIVQLVADEEHPYDQYILDLVNDERSVEEISVESHASEFHVCKAIFDQTKVGAIKVVRPRSSPLPASAATSSLENVVLSSDSLLAKAREHLEASRLEQALRYSRAASSLEPENRRVVAEVKKIEESLSQKVATSGVSPQSVPLLAKPLADLTSIAFSPQEGFMLSRINGTYDIASILKISPMPPLDAQLVFLKLVQGGYVRLK